ncbi:MAG: hypothetical protein VX740_10115 [Pseudomonadota bacterium]|jgi:LPS-assembly lipoprotein|nr:hypothetical protein [Pseudomonadota bacterium]MEC7701838.1 hypothetical protein [Pseudomonadota bacterium]MED5423779.1 hypothetical protein [Pseudomonadota bacterium]MEE3323424.1 hypothetical protein [Pseudomonadota bacterium]
MMKKVKKQYQIRIQFLGVFSSLLMLSGCGFQPIYGNLGTDAKTSSIETQLKQTEIDLISDREGQVLRNLLIDRLHNNGAISPTLYRLNVSTIDETRKDLDLTKESDSTIAQLRLKTNVKLIRKSDQEILLQKNIWTTTSYNILESQFTTRVSRNDARENGLKELARQIEQQVILAIRNQTITK